MQDLNKEDFKNILTLLGRLSDVKGTEVMTIALLQNKLSTLMNKQDAEPTILPEQEATA